MILNKSRPSDAIRLTSIKSDKFKTGILNVSLYFPSSTENSAYNSILSGVMRRGNVKYPDISKINLRLDDLYASTVDIRSSRCGKNLSLVFSCEILDNRFSTDGTDILDGVIEMISQMLFEPKLENGLFPEPIVKQEAKFVSDSIRSVINNTRAYAYNRCTEIMHRNDPDYPTLKKLLEVVENVTAKDLTEFYKTLISSSAIDAFYLGTVDHSEVAQKLSRHFSCHAPESIHIPTPYSPDLPCEFCSEEEKMPVSQGKLAMGMRTGSGLMSGDHHVGILLNEIFGASPASKLFLNVREKLSLCYHCSSSYNILSGNIRVSSGIEVKNRDRAENEIIRQFEDIKNGNVSDKEMFAAKSSLKNVYKQIYDNPFEIYSFYAIRELMGINETVEECYAKIAALTKEDVISLAKKTTLDTVFFVNGTLTSGGDCEEEEND